MSESIPENQYEDLTGIELAGSVASLEGQDIEDVESGEPSSYCSPQQSCDSAIPKRYLQDSLELQLWPPLQNASQTLAVSLHEEKLLKYLPCARLPSVSYAHLKRGLDIMCSLIACIILSPILLACAIAVKVTSPGPIILKQERWGRRDTKFKCLKFRTMVIDTPSDVPATLFTNKASFMTPVGDFLRRWSLDELPQLINILKGDMSIVGPRPVIIRERHLIDLRVPLNADAVRPGLTGWAQINGRNLVSNREKAFLDGEYVANMCLVFDLRVFFKTIVVVLGRRGVDRSAHYDSDGVPF